MTRYDDYTVECCLDCEQRFGPGADAHYALTGHQMGFPIGEHWWEWPIGDEAWGREPVAAAFTTNQERPNG